MTLFCKNLYIFKNNLLFGDFLNHASTFEEILKNAINVMEKYNWHLKYGKWSRDRCQSLLVHSINAATIATRIMKALAKHGIVYSEEDYLTVFAALLIHDYGKSIDEIQEKILTNKSFRLNRLFPKYKDKVKLFLKEIGFDEKICERALELALVIEETSDINEVDKYFEVSKFDRKLTLACRLGDRISSIKYLDEVERIGEEELKPYNLYLTYHQVSIVRGISTQFLHKVLERLYVNQGYSPIMYTPVGTVYIGNSPQPKIDKNEVLEKLYEEVKNFMLEKHAGAAAFGSFVQTKVKSPEILFLSRESYIDFWKYVGNRVSKMGFKNPRKKYLEFLETKYPGLTEPEYIDIFREYRSLQYMFMVFWDVLEKSSLSKDEKNIILEKLAEKLDMDVNLVKQYKVTHTTPFEKVVERMESLWRKLTGEDIVEILTSIFIDMANFFIKSDTGIGIQDSLKQLINEIVFPQLEDTFELISKRWETYLKGKKGIVDICAICGANVKGPAIASLIGDGVESFSNLLEGGVAIGGNTKLKICNACYLEAILRSIIFKGSPPKEVFYIFPQFIISRDIAMFYWTRVNDFLVFFNENVMGLSKTDFWAREIFEKGVNKVLNSIQEYRLTALLDKKGIEKIILNKLKMIYESVDEFKDIIKKYPGGKNISSMEKASALIASLFLDQRINKKDLEELLGIGETLSYFSNNYIVLYLSKSLAKREESDTSTAIRRMFVGLLLARFFHATVIIPDFPMIIATEYRPLGYLKMSKRIGIVKLLRNICKEDWVRIEEIDRVLNKLAALIYSSEIIFGEYGKDTLLEISKRHPGEIMVRASMIPLPKEKMYKLLKSLKRWYDE